MPIYVHMRVSQISNALIALFRNLNALTLDKRGLFQIIFGNERREVFSKKFLMPSHTLFQNPLHQSHGNPISIPILPEDQ